MIFTSADIMHNIICDSGHYYCY